MFLIASSLTVVLMSCGSAKQAVKSLTAVEQPAAQPQVTVAAKEVNVSVGSDREIVMPVVENAKPNPIKLATFVNVEDLLDLNAGMSKQEVYSKLGKKPFDIISTQADGYTVVLYKYKKVHQILNDQNENKLGSTGEKEYSSQIYDAYVVFVKSNKLELVVAQDQMGNSKSVHKFHGELYGLTINGGKLSIKPIIEPEKH